MKRIILKSKDTIKELRKEIKNTKDEKYKTKLKAIIKLKEDKDKKRQVIANELVISHQSLVRWINLYNEQGKKGLQTKKAGRPRGKTKWDNNIFEKLTKEIDKADKYWSIPLMQDWLKEKEDTKIPLSTLWYRVTQLGYSHKSSRPYPYKGNKEKQEKFKKRASRPQYKILSSKTQ